MAALSACPPSATALVNSMEMLVDSRVGVIRRVRVLPKDKGAPDFVYMSAMTCNLDVINPSTRQGIFIGTGVSTDRSSAMAKAVGEAVERYCAAQCVINEFPFATFNSAGFACVEPERFVLFSEAQYSEAGFPYEPFTRHTPTHWVPALNLNTRESVAVPASMVFLYDQKDVGSAINQQISTGLACHTTPAMAAVKAICEVIERDAIAVTWLGRHPQPKIRLDTLSSQNHELLERLQHPGASVTLLHLVMDHGVPVIFAIMRSDMPDAPGLVVAAAAHLDPEHAVRRSLEELAQIWTFSRSVKSQRPRFNAGRQWTNVVDLESHAILYFSHDNTHLAEFLWASSDEKSFDEIKTLSAQDATRDLGILAEQVGALKHNVLLVDITSEDVRSVGLFVFRAIIPGFHPLFMGHRFRALGKSRLIEVRKRMGMPDLVRDRDLNPAPHPFS